MKIYIKSINIDILSKNIDNILNLLPEAKDNEYINFYENNKNIIVGFFRKRNKDLSKEEFDNYVKSNIYMSFKSQAISTTYSNYKKTLNNIKNGIVIAKQLNSEYIELSDDEISILSKFELIKE